MSAAVSRPKVRVVAGASDGMVWYGMAGNWDDQKPLFRGCAGAKYEHGTKCKRELQRVRVTPGKPKVSGIYAKEWSNIREYSLGVYHAVTLLRIG